MDISAANGSIPGKASSEMPDFSSSYCPYYPRDVIVPNYVPNVVPLPILLANFAGLIVLFVTSGLYLAWRINPALRVHDLTALAWFLLC